MLTAQKGNIFLFVVYQSLSKKKLVQMVQSLLRGIIEPQILPAVDYIPSQTEIISLFSFSVLGAHNSAMKGKNSVTIQLMIEE